VINHWKGGLQIKHWWVWATSRKAQTRMVSHQRTYDGLLRR
jgi:hypothetical protein